MESGADGGSVGHAGACSGAGEPAVEGGACDQGGGSGFLQRCVAQNRGSTPAQQRLWRDCIYEEIRVMRSAAHLSIEFMCRLGQVSRAGFYRHWQQREPRAEELELRAQVQQIVVAHRRNYGYRRVTRELRHQGWAVNHKRVARLMAEDNLLCLRRRRFVVTSDSRHDLRVYLNLAARMDLTGIDQLWVADITYLRLADAFLYLAVVLDAFSRRVVGWALDERLDAGLAVAALRQALDLRQPAPGLVHHSDLPAKPAAVPAASMSFFRHEGIYRPDGNRQAREEP